MKWWWWCPLSWIFILHFDFIELPSVDQIQLLIGDHVVYFNENIGNILDTKVKKCLENMVYPREQYILNSKKLNQWLIV
jgi:hypothetical protein